MSLCRIDVQQLAPDRWVTEIECGAFSQRKRVVLRGRSFDEMMNLIGEAYVRQTLPPAHMVPQEAVAAAPPEPVPEPEELSHDDLMAEAEALGMKVDRRWSAARLRDELAQYKAMPEHAAEP